MTNDHYIECNIQNNIATINFYHIKSNSFPSTQLNKLIELFDDLGKNDEVKVIILKSEGEKVFSAGASFDELLTIDEFEKGKKFFMGFANVILAMRRCPKFIVGCVVGKVVGGGVGLVSACDYALASENASIKLSELSIGIGPFVIEPAITRKIGLTNFAELTLNPTEWKSPEWAKNAGMYARVLPNQTDCLDAVNEFAQKLSLYSLSAMHNLKHVFWEGTNGLETIMQERAEMSGRLVLSDFTKETLRKFKAK